MRSHVFYSVSRQRNGFHFKMKIMRLTTIKVPKGCTEIAVDLEDGKLVVSYGSSINEKEFFCKETGHMEEIPGVGDFAILWNDIARGGAIVANIKRNISEGHSKCWVASNFYDYDNAIKFRNYEQYLKIKGEYAEDEL